MLFQPLPRLTAASLSSYLLSLGCGGRGGIAHLLRLLLLSSCSRGRGRGLGLLQLQAERFLDLARDTVLELFCCLFVNGNGKCESVIWEVILSPSRPSLPPFRASRSRLTLSNKLLAMPLVTTVGCCVLPTCRSLKRIQKGKRETMHEARFPRNSSYPSLPPSLPPSLLLSPKTHLILQRLVHNLEPPNDLIRRRTLQSGMHGLALLP